MEAVKKLQEGYRAFLNGYYQENKEKFLDLSENGQRPKTLLISCSDSRVDPGVILQSEPGEVFSVRNVGNLVPPYENDTHHHGVSSALEYGVKVLKVENIMIMGHAKCGAIQAAIDTEHNPEALATDFVHHWIGMVHHVFDHPCCCADSIKSGNRIPEEVEQASIVNSMNNLMEFDFIRESVEAKRLKLYGLHFDIESGTLKSFDRKTGRFDLL